MPRAMPRGDTSPRRMADRPRFADRVDAGRLTDLLRRLVATESINPSLVPSSRGEGAVAALLADECRAAGLEVRLDDVTSGRANVVARLRGRRRGRALMFNGHMDTVGVEGMTDPFGASVAGGRLYGRGAYDMKGSLAAMVEAGRIVAARGLETGELVLAFVTDEEYASEGTTDLIRRERPDAAVVTEPTGLDVCIGHRGFVWARIETTGRAAHGSRFEEGEDAILRMGHVLAALGRLERDILPARPHPLMGRASVHASLIGGGLGLSTYPDRCVLDVERRTLPGEDVEDIAAELRRVVEEAGRGAPGQPATIEITLSRPAYEIAPDADIVRCVCASVEGVRGAPPRLTGELAWLDSALLGNAGIPTVIFGPTGAGAHAAEEWVDLASVADCARVLVEVVSRFCR
jgi:acetylornithine deacetylase